KNILFILFIYNGILLASCLLPLPYYYYYMLYSFKSTYLRCSYIILHVFFLFYLQWYTPCLLCSIIIICYILYILSNLHTLYNIAHFLFQFFSFIFRNILHFS